MGNYHYQYQHFYYSWFLFIIFILFKQGSILVIAQPNQYESTDVSNSRSTLIITTTRSLISYHNNNNEESVDDGEIENLDGNDIYDDEEEGDVSDIKSPSKTVPHTRFNNNITSHLNGETHTNQYDDETGSYQEEDDDEEEEENPIYGDTMSVERPQFNYPTIPSNNQKPIDTQSTSRMPFVSSNLWRDLFTKPAILVGIIGGIVIGMLSAILLVMFIIYRMRKKDEGSYALEEAPRKSPSHAYTRVSSREFFA